MKTLQNRLDDLGSVLSQLVELSAAQQKLNEEKRNLAINIVGMPYYWGTYSGVIESCKADPTSVVARVTDQKTGTECYWKFDALYAAAHLQTIMHFSSWNEYYSDHLLQFAVSYEKLMQEYGFSEQRIAEEMMLYCTKHKISYKSYFNEVA